MKKIFNKTSSRILLVSSLLFISSFFIFSGRASAQTDGKSADDAIDWVKNQVGTFIDVDGAYGAQCVDLIKAYYIFLGQSQPFGNGADYAVNALPEGWTRIQGAVPEKGDVLVYAASIDHPYGHVGIYESDFVTYHQNFGIQKYVRAVDIKYDSINIPYWGVIRPDFSGSGSGKSGNGNSGTWKSGTGEDSDDPSEEDEEPEKIVNTFFSDGTYTYYIQADGTYMKDRLTYHPDGEHIIYFDSEGHEVFDAFTHVTHSIAGEKVDDYCYFNTFGYMYVNTVTYDAEGSKLYYINPYGQLEHDGWFLFDENAEYGDTGEKWNFTGTYLGFANFDGTLLHDIFANDMDDKKVYMQGNGEAKY